MLFRVTREVLIDKVTFKQRPEQRGLVGLRAFWAEAIANTKALRQSMLGVFKKQQSPMCLDRCE